MGQPLHRELVALAGSQDPFADGPASAATLLGGPNALKSICLRSRHRLLVVSVLVATIGFVLAPTTATADTPATTSTSTTPTTASPTATTSSTTTTPSTSTTTASTATSSASLP